MQVPWRPSLEKKSSKGHSPLTRLIHKCGNNSGRADIQFAGLSFIAKFSFSRNLFLSLLFRLYHHRSSLLSSAIDLVTAKPRIRRSCRIGQLKVFRSHECGTILGNKGRAQSEDTLIKGGGLHRNAENSGKYRRKDWRDREPILRIARRSFVAKLLYRSGHNYGKGGGLFY